LFIHWVVKKAIDSTKQRNVRRAEAIRGQKGRAEKLRNCHRQERRSASGTVKALGGYKRKALKRGGLYRREEENIKQGGCRWVTPFA